MKRLVRMALFTYLSFATVVRADDVYSRIDACESSGGGSCVFSLLREIAGRGGNGQPVCVIPRTRGNCKLIKFGEGWSYVIYKDGSLYHDVRWNEFGGAGNGSNSKEQSCQFLDFLVDEGICH